MSDVTAHLLAQLIWHQIVVASSWNINAEGEVFYLDEPVSEALGRCVVMVLRRRDNVPDALDHFVARLHEMLDEAAEEVGLSAELAGEGAESSFPY